MTVRLPMLQPPTPTREQLRSRRKRALGARTISFTRMSKREIDRARELYPDDGHTRPQTRAECVNGPRPCPYVSCKHNLFLDVSPSTGAIKLNFPDLEPDEIPESCALDVAERGGVTLERVAELMNITRERVRQIENEGLQKVHRFAWVHELLRAIELDRSDP